MARAIQVFLQRQGYADLNSVEAILLCADPATNVDSVRPIIRVVMRDAVERFAVTISQGRLVLNPESCFDVVNRLLTAPAPAPTKLVEAAAATAATQAAEQDQDPYVPAFALEAADPCRLPRRTGRAGLVECTRRILSQRDASRASRRDVERDIR